MRDYDFSGTTSRAGLSVWTPRNRACRSLPCAVQSMNATCTTTSGPTQCARTRGRPMAIVNGDLEIWLFSSRERNSSSSFLSNPVPTFPAKTNSCL